MLSIIQCPQCDAITEKITNPDNKICYDEHENPTTNEPCIMSGSEISHL